MVRARFKAGGPGEVGTTELGAPLPLLSSTRPAGTGGQLWRYEAYQPMIRSLLAMGAISAGWVAVVVVVVMVCRVPCGEPCELARRAGCMVDMHNRSGMAGHGGGSSVVVL
jgi:hypothetical protein